jgi:hypothetical protein
MRTCIFCDSPVNSKEDAWPLWLIRRLGNSEKGIVEGQRGRQAPRSWRAGKYPLRTGNVCKNCNNGWMSDLENRVRPIMERFFLDQKVSLDQHDQATLAIWTCKNAMVYETLRHKSAWFFTSQEHESFRESFHLPLHTSIWIAKSVEFTGLFCTASDLNGTATESLDQVKAYVNTMAFGPIAIQILNAKMSKPIHQNVTISGNLQPGPLDQTTIQIWPVNTNMVSWPNEVGLNGELGLDHFAHRWKQTTR